MDKHRSAARLITGLALAAGLMVGLTGPAHAADTGWNGTKVVRTTGDTGWNGTKVAGTSRDTGWNGTRDTGWNGTRDTGWNGTSLGS